MADGKLGVGPYKNKRPASMPARIPVNANAPENADPDADPRVQIFSDSPEPIQRAQHAQTPPSTSQEIIYAPDGRPIPHPDVIYATDGRPKPYPDAIYAIDGRRGQKIGRS
jgi:hypothetical protein